MRHLARKAVLTTLVVVFATLAGAAPAHALIIRGCVVVANPTPTNHTSCPGMDLAYSSFDQLNLAYADFTGAYFYLSSFIRADLHGATFDDAYLGDGNLSSANLRGASFRRAGIHYNTLAWSDATGADFTGAGLEETNLQGTVFANANLTDADLTNALFSRADGLGRFTSFAGATLNGAEFTGTLIDNAPFVPVNVVVGAQQPDGVNVTWPAPLSMPGATGGPCVPPSGSFFPMGVTTVTCRVDDDHGTHGFGDFTVDVQAAAPSVTVQPVPVTVLAGKTASFSAAATGLPAPTVVWQSSADGGTTFTPIAGATSPTYSFTAQVFDSGKLFRAVFSNPYGTATTNSVALTVTPVVPTVLPGVGTVLEGDAGNATLKVPVTLSVASNSPVTVDWTTLNLWPNDPGFAVAPADFTMASGTVTFAPGETQAYVSVPVVGDRIDEANELVVVSFGNPTNAHMGGYWGLGFGTITDDDPTPVVVPGTGTVVEGNAGTVSLDVPVTLSNPSSRPVTVPWTTLNLWPNDPGFAVAPADFTMASDTVTFAPGETQAYVSVPVVGDRIDETNELVVVAFGNPTNAHMGGYWGLGFGTITDDD